MARERVNALRRAAERSIRNGSNGNRRESAAGDLKLIPTWIPGNGFVRFSKFTIDDVRARADYYERLAGAHLAAASWLRELADTMEAHGYETVNEVRSDEYPATPEGVEPEDILA